MELIWKSATNIDPECIQCDQPPRVNPRSKIVTLYLVASDKETFEEVKSHTERKGRKLCCLAGSALIRLPDPLVSDLQGAQLNDPDAENMDAEESPCSAQPDPKALRRDQDSPTTSKHTNL